MTAIEEHVLAAVEDFTAKKAPVVIFKTDESGDWGWAVCVEGSDFWLDFCNTVDEAVNYAKDRDLPYTVL